MIRVLFPESTNAAALGGYQHSTFDIIAHLGRSGAPVSLYYVAQEGTAAIAEARRRDLPARLIAWNGGGFPGWRHPLWVLQYVWRAWRVLKREKIDIVQASNETLLFWLIPCLLAGTKPIWNVRAEMPGDLRGRLRQWLHLLFCRHLIHVSSAVERSVAQNGVPFAVHQTVIRNFVPRELIQRQVAPRDPRDLTVSFVGRVDDPNKRADLALEIALRVLQRHPKKAFFHFWGRINDAALAQLTARIPHEHRDRFEFHGTTDDVGEIYDKTNVLLLTSLSEGSPRVVMEAGAAAIPTLATPAGGVPELIVDGVTGHLFETAEAGAALLETLIEDPQHLTSLGRAARTHFVENFHYAPRMEQYLAFYDGCLSKTSAKRGPRDTDVEPTAGGVAA